MAQRELTPLHDIGVEVVFLAEDGTWQPATA
jgi:hypothetical protein